MKFIDCNACIGMSVVNHEITNHENFVVKEKIKAAQNAHELLEYMNYCGIEQALVWHQTMYDVDPEYGNEKVSILPQQYADRLFKTWTILPSITDEAFEIGGFLDKMKTGDIKALRAFPLRNRYFLNKIVMNEQLKTISDFHIPLYLSPTDGYDYIYTLMSEYPELTVILCNIGLWSPTRYLYPLLKAYKNVYFETGDFQTNGGFKDLCLKIGSEKALFGTNFPVNNMGGPIASLLGANIKDIEKENISYRNIERVLGEVRI